MGPRRRPGVGREKSIVRALAWGAMLVVISGWAGYSFRATVELRGTKPKPVSVTAVETTAKSKSSGAGEEHADASRVAGWEGNTSRAPPWEKEGCQTIVFFHVPKTGGESVNDLWLNGAGRERVPAWKDGYTLRSLRVTRLEPSKQANLLRNM